MPIGNGDLAGDQGGRVPEAVIQNFKNILSVLKGNRISHPIIEHQQTDLGQRCATHGSKNHRCEPE